MGRSRHRHERLARMTLPGPAGQAKLGGRPHGAAQLTRKGGAMSAYHPAPPETGR